MSRLLDSQTLIQLINRISTDIDIFSEEFIRDLVLLEDVIVGASTCEGRAEEEAENPVQRQNPSAKVLTVRRNGPSSGAMKKKLTLLEMRPRVF